MQSLITNQPTTITRRDHEITRLINQLGSPVGLERQAARERLAALGQPVVPALIDALSAKRDIIRWEAAKTFTTLHAPAAAAALVERLEDDNIDVRWLAAEALIGLGASGLEPLFTALMARVDAQQLREGAHQICALDIGDLAEVVKPVLDSLKRPEPDLATPLAAERAFLKLRSRKP